MEIDKELIEKILRENIENQLKDYDFNYQIREIIRDIFIEKIELNVNKIIDKKLEVEIQNVLKGEIDTNDGWGRKKHWDSFETMFKSKFNEKMNEDWGMKTLIRTTIEERLDRLFKEKTKDVTEKIQDMVLDEMLKEENKNGSKK